MTDKNHSGRALPNRVSSRAEAWVQRTRPLRLACRPNRPVDEVWDEVADAIRGMKRSRAVRSEGRTIRAEFVVWPIPFVDDVRLDLATDGTRVDIESASRVGHFDLFVNRIRVCRIRRVLRRRGLTV